MIDAPGIVTALDGDFAIVRMEESGCGRCHETGGCGGNNIGRLFCSAPRSFRVLNPGKSSPGDRVVVAIDEGALRRSALMCYGLPLLALFIGAFCGSALAGEKRGQSLERSVVCFHHGCCCVMLSDAKRLTSDRSLLSGREFSSLLSIYRHTPATHWRNSAP